MHTIQELENSIYSVGALRGAAVKPFGSFVSNPYAKSGDLDVSVEFWNDSNLPINKKKEQNILRELMRALQIRGVARNMEFIPNARVPVLQYVSDHFGISCDISIDNYPCQIKSKIFYWIDTLDERFGDTVLLVKEWAKAQNINDPKNGTLNSFSLCLLVIFHFQTCDPVISPPLKEIYDGNISGLCGKYIKISMTEHGSKKSEISFSSPGFFFSKACQEMSPVSGCGREESTPVDEDCVGTPWRRRAMNSAHRTGYGARRLG